MISHGIFPVKQGSPAETSATEGCRARRRSSLDLGVREKSQFYGVFFPEEIMWRDKLEKCPTVRYAPGICALSAGF